MWISPDNQTWIYPDNQTLAPAGFNSTCTGNACVVLAFHFAWLTYPARHTLPASALGRRL
eukprot:56856-Rhodomonas_salina.2